MLSVRLQVFPATDGPVREIGRLQIENVREGEHVSIYRWSRWEGANEIDHGTVSHVKARGAWPLVRKILSACETEEE